MRKNKLLLLLVLLMTAATGAWAQDTYTVSLKDDVKDADKWTISPNPAEEGQTVTLQYTGRLKVKGVKATSDAAAPSVPEGALSGVFSVSDTKKVYFSKGNLQATYNTSWSWAFATNQWDYIGNAAGNTSINGGGTISGTGTVDLFGWVGAACAWTGAAQYGISNVMAAAQYGNVEGEALKSDWGTLAISNGGNTANFGWHSLASSEWEYLFKTRTTPSSVRYAHATVNSVPGLVLLPDDWSTDYYSLNNVNDAIGNGYTDNVISSSDWTSKLEAHGAVFLPAGGYRNGATVNDAGDKGNYWSSTSIANTSARYFFFGSARFMGITSNSTRNRGCSVRLVREVATSDEKPAEATPALSISNPSVGQVIGSDGKNYAYGSLPTGVTAVAKICYVSGSNGLALALTDEKSGWTMNWSTAKTTCAAHTAPFTGGTWKLASKDEWSNMIAAAGSDLRDGFSSVGGTNMQEGRYWSSTEYESVSSAAYYYDFYDLYWNADNKNSDGYVRACLAFTIEQAAKPAATVTTAPTGAAVVGVGKTTALVSGGAAEGGTLWYAVTTTNTKPTSTAGFSDAVPTAQTITASGKVYVWYYVKGDDTHSDSEIAATAIEVPVADIVWDVTNISDLGAFEGDPYEKEGVTMSSNSGNVFATWTDNGDPTTDGIAFDAYETGGYTFTAPAGKVFTKIEMNAVGPDGWDTVNLGTGWAFNNPIVTWKGTAAASTVELLTDDGFVGDNVKSIAFYLVDAE